MKSAKLKTPDPVDAEPVNAKTVDQIKFTAPLGSQEHYAEVATRWGYEQFSPFVRRLLDAAAKGDPESGMIQFFRGADSHKSAGA